MQNKLCRVGAAACISFIVTGKKNDESISRPNIGQNPHVLSSYWSENIQVSRVRARRCATGPHCAFKVGSTAGEHGKSRCFIADVSPFPGPVRLQHCRSICCKHTCLFCSAENWFATYLDHIICGPHKSSLLVTR